MMSFWSATFFWEFYVLFILLWQNSNPKENTINEVTFFLTFSEKPQEYSCIIKCHCFTSDEGIAIILVLNPMWFWLYC